MKKLGIKDICAHLVDNKYKRILLMFIAILLLNSLIDVTTGTNVIKKSVNQVLSSAHIYTEEKKNMTPLKSAGYDTEVGGSVKVEKSADWTGYKKARININLDTIGALPDGSSTPTAGIDAIFVVDTSGSMYGSKLTQVKQDVINLSNEVLDNNNNAYSIKFISLLGDTPNRQLNDSMDSYLWINNDTFIYSKKSKGIFLYDLNTGVVSRIITGKEEYILKGYENGILKYDKSEIEI